MEERVVFVAFVSISYCFFTTQTCVNTCIQNKKSNEKELLRLIKNISVPDTKPFVSETQTYFFFVSPCFCPIVKVLGYSSITSHGFSQGIYTTCVHEQISHFTLFLPAVAF